MSDDPKKIAADILERMRQDETPDDVRLMIAYRDDGYIRRIVVDDLDRRKAGQERWQDPTYPLTGARLRALCKAIVAVKPMDAHA